MGVNFKTKYQILVISESGQKVRVKMLWLKKLALEMNSRVSKKISSENEMSFN